MIARLILIAVLLSMTVCHFASAQEKQPLPNEFYAMDTCTKRPYPRNDITPAAQLDMIKALGYRGIAWTEEDPTAVKQVAQAAKERGLKMHAIYCAARVSDKGISVSNRVVPIIKTLKGHGTILWLHIGGKGPEFSKLTSDHAIIRDLRQLAKTAAENSLDIAIYPHVGEWTERVQNAVAVAKLVDQPNFGVCFNLCHCLAMGDEEKIPDLLKDAKPYLKTVTINGADSGVKGAQWRRLIQNLDKGSYDLNIVLNQLRSLEFTGPIGLQGYGIGGDRRENLANSMTAWRQLSGQE